MYFVRDLYTEIYVPYTLHTCRVYATYIATHMTHK